VTAIFKEFKVTEVVEFLEKNKKTFNKDSVLDPKNAIHIIENDKSIVKNEIF